MRRVKRALLKISLGVSLGLVIAEVAFLIRDDAAFPHVNFYEPDPELGARLQPHASQRLRLNGNPTTSIRTNSRGFRGAEWPVPVDGELIVVGDSQVFGLGVDEHDTFPAQLAAATGRQVINAGVPTYGPAEYLAVARTLLAERPKAKLVFVFNVANDFFELSRPNRDRHTVWDGWAIRKEHGPPGVTAFPGRRWLFSQSHLVFAARKLLLEARSLRGDSESLAEFSGQSTVPWADRGAPSEGSWTDLLTQDELHQRRVAEERSRAEAERLATVEQREPVERRLQDTQRALDSTLSELDEASRREEGSDDLLRLRVGDVVRDRYAEIARHITITAEMLAAASKEKARLRLARARLEKQVVPLEGVLEKSIAELEALRWDIPSPPREPVAGQDVIDALAALDDATLVVLPLDVQVSPGEWAKYGAEPQAMTQTLELNRALFRAATDRGLRAVELTSALAAAEPGAFLYGDLHLTPKGTRVAAAAVAEALKRPPTPRLEVEPVPSPAEWAASGSVLEIAGCETRRVRDWLRLRCRDGESGPWFNELRLVEGPRSKAHLARSPGRFSAVLQLAAGRRWRLQFDRTSDPDDSRNVEMAELTVFGAGPEATVALKAPAEAVAAPIEPDADQRLVHCEKLLAGRDSVAWGHLQTDSPCLAFPDCVRRLACAQGHPNARPHCPEGQRNAGFDGRCLIECETDEHCDWATAGRLRHCSKEQFVCLESE